MQHTRLWEYFPTVMVPAVVVTIEIMLATAILSIVFGVIIGTFLVLTDENGLMPRPVWHQILNKITDIIRSFPSLILLVALTPLTRIVIGTAIGPQAAIFAMTIGCTPFAARMTENSLQQVDPAVIKAARSFGASTYQIVTKVMFIEALPTLASNFTILLINMLNVSALAGAVGAGGLGAVALTYGYQRFDYGIMYCVVVILMLFVFFIQGMGTKLYKKWK